MKCKIFLIYPLLSFSADKFQNEIDIIENKTKQKGWQYGGICEEQYDNTLISLRYSFAPKGKDIGDYAFIDIKKGDKIISFSGFDIFPFSTKNNCQIEYITNIVVLDTYDYSAAKRYQVFINVDKNKKTEYRYNLKHTSIFSKKLNEDSYLIAGFGLCKSDGSYSWIYDRICKTIPLKKYHEIQGKIQNRLGFSIYPYIPGGGIGAFKYYLICDRCNYEKNSSIDKEVKDYLLKVHKKIKKIEKSKNKKSIYSTYLAFSSILYSKFPEAKNLLKKINFTYQNDFELFWKEIYKNNYQRRELHNGFKFK
ncbi:hypothetical protein AB835_02770 [Candidatus Endobugula sertula]|uniref:Uncharacterized protein n=1 Tax=Candidatus Endobugula sertula TaxID=62101 RepID=A0A1D2QSH3_9GAMM|nr:hypothetical protein AB835_02770 [Candidatus Endobugula sertula]